MAIRLLPFLLPFPVDFLSIALGYHLKTVGLLNLCGARLLSGVLLLGSDALVIGSDVLVIGSDVLVLGFDVMPFQRDKALEEVVDKTMRLANNCFQVSSVNRNPRLV